MIHDLVVEFPIQKERDFNVKSLKRNHHSDSTSKFRFYFLIQLNVNTHIEMEILKNACPSTLKRNRKIANICSSVSCEVNFFFRITFSLSHGNKAKIKFEWQQSKGTI